MNQITTLEGFNRGVKVTLKQIYSDPLIKMKKYTDSHTTIGAGIDQNGLPVTGLTEDYDQPSGAPINKKVQGTRKAMEKLLELPEGTLKNTSPYWNTFFIKTGNEEIELDLLDNYDLLKYLFLRAQSIVADGLKEIGTNSSFEFVLSSKEQEAALKVQNRQYKKDAYKLSEQLDLETKINILAVYGDKADATSPNSIIDKIDEKIEADAKLFLERAGDPFLLYKSLVTYALDKGVFTMSDGAIYHGDVVVGHTKDMAAEAISKDRQLEAITRAKISGDMDLIKDVIIQSKKELTIK